LYKKNGIRIKFRYLRKKEIYDFLENNFFLDKRQVFFLPSLEYFLIEIKNEGKKYIGFDKSYITLIVEGEKKYKPIKDCYSVVKANQSVYTILCNMPIFKMYLCNPIKKEDFIRRYYLGVIPPSGCIRGIIAFPTVLLPDEMYRFEIVYGFLEKDNILLSDFDREPNIDKNRLDFIAKKNLGYIMQKMKIILPFKVEVLEE